MSGAFDGTKHILPLRVYYEDTDFSGIVYHANYLRFAERGRSDFIRLAGVNHRDMAAREPSLAFAVSHMDIGFHGPARIDDMLSVETVFTHAKGARMRAVQRILCEGRLLWQARVDIACIDMDGRPRRLPADIVEKLAGYVSSDMSLALE